MKMKAWGYSGRTSVLHLHLIFFLQNEKSQMEICTVKPRSPGVQGFSLSLLQKKSISGTDL